MNTTAPRCFQGRSAGWLCLAICLAISQASSTCPAVSPDRQGKPTHDSAASASGLDRFVAFTEPFRKVEISAAESGPISQLLTRRGANVRSGDLLIALDSSVLESSRQIAEWKCNSTTRVDALEIESRTLHARFEKLRDLVQEGAGSKEEVERAEADASVASLEVEAAKEELELRRLELKEIDSRIRRRQVRSPIDGVVTEITKELGEYVSAQDPHVVTVVQLERLRAVFYIPTRLARSIDAGHTLELLFPESQRRCIGTVEYVGVVTEADSGRVRLDLVIDNNDFEYRSGVRCELLITGRQR